MKVLVVTNYYPPVSCGTYETRCHVVVQALRNLDHDVQVLTSDLSAEIALADESHVQRKLKINASNEDSQPAAEWEKINATVLHDELARVQPDVVHVWSLKGFSYAFLTLLQRLKIPVVYDVCDTWLVELLDQNRLLGWWNRQPRKKHLSNRRTVATNRNKGLLPTISRSIAAKQFHWSSIYFCSNYIKNNMRVRGHAVEDAPVIQCFFECDRVQPKCKNGNTEKLLWIGDFSHEDDPTTVIKAFQGLVRQGNEHATLHMYSTQSTKHASSVSSWVEQFGLATRIHIQPLPTSQANVPYANHDAFIFTSSDANPHLHMLMHAMAAGLPVIAAGNGGAPELVKDDFNGFTFNTGDANDLQQKIHKLFSMNDKGAILGRNGMDYVQRRLKKDEIIGQIEACLLQAVAISVDYTV